MADDCNIPALARRNKKQGEPIGAAQPRDAIEKVRGIGTPVEDRQNLVGGVAWPLTEVDRTTDVVRIYDPSDASIWVDVERIVELTLEDAAGVQGKLILTPTP